MSNFFEFNFILYLVLSCMIGILKHRFCNLRFNQPVVHINIMEPFNERDSFGKNGSYIVYPFSPTGKIKITIFLVFCNSISLRGEFKSSHKMPNFKSLEYG